MGEISPTSAKNKRNTKVFIVPLLSKPKLTSKGYRKPPILVADHVAARELEGCTVHSQEVVDDWLLTWALLANPDHVHGGSISAKDPLLGNPARVQRLRGLILSPCSR